MKRDRSELEKNLKEVLQQVKHNNKVTTRIKEELLKNKITYGDSQKWISGETPLNEIEELEKFCLLAMATYLHTLDITQIDSSSIDPKIFFNDTDIRHAEVYKEIKKVKTLEFPYTFRSKMLKVKEGHYIGTISAQEWYELNRSGLLFYNFKTQRNAIEKASKDDPNTMIATPRISTSNVKKMVKLGKSGRLESTLAVFNARLGTAFEGEEILYDENEMKLTIAEGTFLDILDGFNRQTSVSSIISDENHKNFNMAFELRLLNYDEEQAQEHFYQISQGMKVSKSSTENKSSEIYPFVAKRVRDKSELRDKVSESETLSANYLISLSTLIDSIRTEFNINENDKPEAMKVSKFIVEFINELFMEYPEAFMTNISEVRKESLMNVPQMFYGYMALVAKMYYGNIPVDKATQFIKQIGDFSRNNSIWKERGILNEQGHITANTKKKIKDIFKSLEIKVSA